MKKTPFRRSTLAALISAPLAAAWLAGCVTAQPSETDASQDDSVTVSEIADGVVIADVTVVDVSNGSLWPHRSVVLKGSRIERVAKEGTVRAVGNAQVVDGRGKYLVPGFLDMHTHAVPQADADPSPWPLMVASGITGIREMAGSPELLARAHRLNDDEIAGRVTAPEILAMPGPLIVGAATAEQGRALVARDKAMGADFVKLIAASREASLAILDEAHKQGLVVAGHLSPSLSAVDSSNAGWHSVEHLGSGIGLILDCSSEEPAIRGDFLANAARPTMSPLYIASPMLFRASDERFYRRIEQTFDPARCEHVLDTFERNDTWQVPTLIRLKGIERSDDPALMANPALAGVDPTTRALWTMLAHRYRNEVPASARQAFSSYYDLQRRVVGQMAARGVRIMAGSDLGGIWMVPGDSLHQEFHELAAAGLTPLQVLQSTTINGAVYLHRESTMGSVATGRDANLVMLDGNPIADVANLDRISVVVLRGRVLDSAALAGMKAQVVGSLAKRPLKDLASAVDMSHDHAD
jgi:imidazolonepropionase-like amidohydrolase